MYAFLCLADHIPLRQGFGIGGRSSDLSDPMESITLGKRSLPPVSSPSTTLPGDPFVIRGWCFLCKLQFLQ